MLEIPVYGAERPALVDEYDEHLVSLPWHVNEGYARNSRHGYLHRIVMGLERGDPRQVDHINRDRLDNRRENLRIVTIAQQRHNQPARDGSSRYRGVSLHKRTGRWTAQVRVRGHKCHLGYFATEEEAATVAAEFRRAHLSHAVD